MIPVVDRVPTYPGRVKITKEAGGQVEYVTWERADEPTVEGTPINKALFDSIQADIGLSENVTVYVSQSGSDTLGEGSAANPYATITKALSTIPKNLGGHTAYVSITSGVHNEDVLISGFGNGELRFTGVTNATITIRKLAIERTAHFSCQSVLLSVGTGGIDVSSGSYATFGQPVTVSGGNNAVHVHSAAHARFVSLTVNNSTDNAVYANGGVVYVSTLAGSGNNIGVVANRGGLCTYDTLTLTATARLLTANGGRIYTGSQTSIPNY